MRLILKTLAALTLMATMPIIAFAKDCPALLAHTMPKLHSDKTVDLCEAFKGKPLLIVNTASHCGFTGQFRDLQALYESHNERGLEILGIPSDSFKQEAKTAAETAQICYRNYGVTFTMAAEQNVKGAGAHELFQQLKAQTGDEPQWNFHKFLLDRDGNVVSNFPSHVKPTDPEILQAVESIL